MLILEIKKTGKLMDFDNYFVKPFVDGIRDSRFIRDDSSKNLIICYSNLDSETQFLKATLINYDYFDKYKDLILSSLKF